MYSNPGAGSPFWKGRVFWLGNVGQKHPNLLDEQGAKKVGELINDEMVCDYFGSAIDELARGNPRMPGGAEGSKRTNANLGEIVNIFVSVLPDGSPLKEPNSLVSWGTGKIPWRAVFKWYYPLFYDTLSNELSRYGITLLLPDIRTHPNSASMQVGPDDDFSPRESPLKSPYVPTQGWNPEKNRRTKKGEWFEPKQTEPPTEPPTTPPPTEPPTTPPPTMPPQEPPTTPPPTEIPPVPTEPTDAVPVEVVAPPVTPTEAPSRAMSVPPTQTTAYPPSSKLDGLVAKLVERERKFVEGGGTLVCARSETEEQTRRRVRALADCIPLLRKLAKIHGFIKGGPYVWADPMDADIYTACWLIKNGSIVLKGVPGTGKTQLVEMSAMFFGNDVLLQPDRGAGVLKELGDLKAFLTERGVLGEAKHNQEKEPQDVFFSSAIAIEKFRLPAGKQIPLVTTTIPPPPSDNPGPQMESRYDQWGYRQVPDEVEQYAISPVARPVVFSLIKFHNEANRMNVNVADTLLGLMAENVVEYHGVPFYSPAFYNAHTGKLENRKTDDMGTINIFDYNPHLEMEHPEMELDRALLDRITAGIFISAGNMASRFRVLAKSSKQPRDIAFLKLKEASKNPGSSEGLEPITRAELETLWKLLPLIPMDAEALTWMNFFTNIPNLSNRTYDDTVYQEMPTKETRDMVDKSICTFGEMIVGAPDTSTQIDGQSELSAGSLQVAVDNIERPCGMRASISMVNVIKASAILSTLEEQAGASDEKLLKALADVKLYIPNKQTREGFYSTFLEVLPYILDHRVNLGVSKASVQKKFLSTFHLFKFYIAPLMRKKENKTRYYAYMQGFMVCELKFKKGEHARQEVEDAFYNEAVQRYNESEVENSSEWDREKVIHDRVENSFLKSLFSQLSLYIKE